MESILQGFITALGLILHFDQALFGIIFLSLKVSGLALVIATSLGLPLGKANARLASALAVRDVAYIPLHYQVVTWAMTRSLDYTARTDEFTFAHQFRAAR